MGFLGYGVGREIFLYDFAKELARMSWRHNAKAVGAPSSLSTMTKQQAELCRAPKDSSPSKMSLGLPTAANKAPHIAASVFLATLTTISANCFARANYPEACSTGFVSRIRTTGSQIGPRKAMSGVLLPVGICAEGLLQLLRGFLPFRWKPKILCWGCRFACGPSFLTCWEKV